MPTFQSTMLDIFYADYDLDTLSKKDQPLLKYISFKKHGGEAVKKRFTLSGARSTTSNRTEAIAIAAAKAGGRSSDHHAFLVPFGEFTGQIDLIVKDIALSEGSDDAAAQAMITEINAGVGDFGQSVVEAYAGNAGKALGTAVFSTSDFSLQFTDPWIAGMIFDGDQLVISEDDGSDASHVQVGSVANAFSPSPSTGKVIVGTTAAPSTPANPGSWVNSTTYYVFRRGQFNPTNPTRSIVGLGDYLPNSWSTSISALAGVTRSLDERLAGVRLASNEVGTLTLSERIKYICAKGHQTSGWKPGGSNGYICLLSPKDFAQLEREMMNQAIRDLDSGTTEEGYEAIFVRTAVGRVACVAEPAKPSGTFMILCTKHLEIYTPNGKMVNFQDLHGSKLIHKTALEYEVRTLLFPASVIGNPGYHGVGPTA